MNSETIKSLNNCIADLDLDDANYLLSKSLSDLKNNNIVYLKDKIASQLFNVKFAPNVSGGRVYIGVGNKGKLNTIRVEYSDSRIYIGDDCNLKNLSLRGGNIYIGNGVSSHVGRWQSGTHQRELSGSKPCLESMIIVGDDCMFSRDITLRTSDAHPIVDIDTMDIVNTSTKSIILEPHIWVCENVSIMKGVMVGACSILSLGAIVTKDVPRNSSVGGIPGKARALDGRVWSRNTSKSAISKAKYYYNKFCKD